MFRSQTVYNYDEQGRLHQVIAKKLNGTVITSPAVGLVTSYTYDADGDKLSETLPNGDVTNYSYDSLNRLTGVATTLGSTSIFSQSYVYNDDSTKQSVHETQLQAPDATGVSQTVTSDTAWTYDFDQRLTGGNN